MMPRARASSRGSKHRELVMVEDDVEDSLARLKDYNFQPPGEVKWM